VRGPSPVSAIAVSFQVPSLAIPAIRVVRKEEDRRSYSLPSASGDHVPAHHSPSPFQCRGCELPLVLLGPRGAFTEPRRPLTFSLSLEGTPDQPLCCPMRCPPSTLLSVSLARDEVEHGAEIHRRVEGPRVDSPVRAGRAKARERLPSYRERASRNPQAEPARTFLIVCAFPRTVSPSLRLVPPVRRGFRASFWLAPCWSDRPCDLPESKTRDASDRLLPPER
jgi:hypothetical protein